MSASLFASAKPDFNRVEIVTDPSLNPSYWYVRYDGRTLTSADLFYCCQWVAHARRGLDY